MVVIVCMRKCASCRQRSVEECYPMVVHPQHMALLAGHCPPSVMVCKGRRGLTPKPHETW
jgi:hypothetical protein